MNNPSEDQIFQNLTNEYLSCMESHKNKLAYLNKKLAAYDELVKAKKKYIDEYQDILN